MLNTKIIKIERKLDHGVVLQTIDADIIIVLKQRKNGRVTINIELSKNSNIIVYRIDARGNKENKR